MAGATPATRPGLAAVVAAAKRLRRRQGGRPQLAGNVERRMHGHVCGRAINPVAEAFAVDGETARPAGDGVP